MVIAYAPSWWLALYPWPGVLAALALLLWGAWLCWRPQARARWWRGWWWRAPLAVALLALVADAVHTQRLLARIAADSAADQVRRRPTLAQAQTLAGLAMPAGTQLLLPLEWGQPWMQPGFFEQAQFAQPVRWQGALIAAMRREFAPRTDAQTWRTTALSWGEWVHTPLAQPQRLNGFDCQGEVRWRLPSAAAAEAVSANAPAPRYEMHACTLSGQRFAAAGGAPLLQAPAGSLVLATRWPDPHAADGARQVWAVQPPEGGSLGLNGLWLRQAQALLHNTPQPTLWAAEGVLAPAPAAQSAAAAAAAAAVSADCPLPVGAWVRWSSLQPQCLQVQGADGGRALPPRCGAWRVRATGACAAD